MALVRPDELSETTEEEIAISPKQNADNSDLGHISPSAEVSYNVHYGSVFNNFVQTINQPLADDSEATKSTADNTSTASFRDSNLLKEKLQLFYQKITLPPITWLNQTEDLAIDKIYVSPDLSLDSSKIDKEDIFKEVDGIPPKRILIEAQPGYGKTSFALRLAYDWAIDENYMKQFKFVFLIPIKELASQNIETEIQDIAARCGFLSREKALDILNSNEDQTLFILDGLTEISKSKRFEILQVLYKQKFSDLKIIVTSNTGLFSLDTTEKQKLLGEFPTQKTFHDKHIMLLGIKSHDAKYQLLSNLTLNKFSKDSNPLFKYSYMFDSPIFMYVIAFLLLSKDTSIDITQWSSDHKIELVLTQLFKQLSTYILQHPFADQFDLFYINLKKENLRTKFTNCSAFNSKKHSLQHAQTHLYHFGKLAIDQIGKPNVRFEMNQLTLNIRNLGLLRVYEDMSSFDTESYYEPYHSSIIDFAAAYYIWLDLNLNDGNFSVECLERITKYCKTDCIGYDEMTSLPLFSFFLFGLIQDKCIKLFKNVYEELANGDSILKLLLTDPNNTYRKVSQFVQHLKQ